MRFDGGGSIASETESETFLRFRISIHRTCNCRWRFGFEFKMAPRGTEVPPHALRRGDLQWQARPRSRRARHPLRRPHHRRLGARDTSPECISVSQCIFFCFHCSSFDYMASTASMDSQVAGWSAVWRSNPAVRFREVHAVPLLRGADVLPAAAHLHHGPRRRRPLAARFFLRRQRCPSTPRVKNAG